MKVLIFGHWSHTGFGVVTQALTERWVKQGIDVRVIAVNYRGDPIGGLMAGRIWPANIAGHTHGGNISHEAVTGELWQRYRANDDWRPDAVLMVADAGTLFGYLGPIREGQQDVFGPFGRLVPTWNYVPIEGDNLNPSWRDIWEHIQPVAMSNYGQGVIQDFLNRPVPRIYHGVDTDAFYPVDPSHPVEPFPGMIIRSKAEAKRQAGFNPQRKVVLRCDRLVERKQYHVLMAAMRMAWKEEPETDLVLHCYPTDDGLNLYEEIARLGPTLAKNVRLIQSHDTFTGLPQEALCALYNSADLYVSPTGGEGFGLTLAESMACGVPVVTTKYAAGIEVVGHGGILVDPIQDKHGNVVKLHSRYGMDWALSDAEATAHAIIRLLGKPQERRSMGQLARMHVVKNFSWDTAAEQFLSLFVSGIAEFQLRENSGSPADNG